MFTDDDKKIMIKLLYQNISKSEYLDRMRSDDAFAQQEVQDYKDGQAALIADVEANLAKMRAEIGQ